MKQKINGYINSIMEESALIKDSGMLFLLRLQEACSCLLRISCFPSSSGPNVREFKSI
ncbi:hypothetical protein L6303_05835 [archaeon]|nr:hypothetical protein [Nanoarchaeota archaeon]MBU4300435.1 hypothetical protein [Nanoarchaeota archaeon]MBU4451248.1 hypothetical protein [Nanoarchaeota archaeon]MCG2724239.1 hypothetical protein [archaeon]